MSEWTTHQIKELVRVEIDSERRLRDALRAGDREAFQEYRESMERALKVSIEESKRDRAELERRLTILNHAHEEAVRVLATYLPREIYARAMEELVAWRGKTDLQLSAMELRLKNTETGVSSLPGGLEGVKLQVASQAAQNTGSRMTLATVLTAVGIAAAIAIGLASYFK